MSGYYDVTVSSRRETIIAQELKRNAGFDYFNARSGRRELQYLESDLRELLFLYKCQVMSRYLKEKQSAECLYHFALLSLS